MGTNSDEEYGNSAVAVPPSQNRNSNSHPKRNSPARRCPMSNTHVRRGRGGYGSGRGRGGGSGPGRSWQPGAGSANAGGRHDADDLIAENNNGNGDDFGETAALQADELRQIDAMDAKMGFERFTDGPDRLGWLVNMHPVG